MKIVVRKVGDNIYEGFSLHWMKIGEKMYRYDRLNNIVDNHYWRPFKDFEITPTDISRIAPRDRSKPEKYLLPHEQMAAINRGG